MLIMDSGRIILVNARQLLKQKSPIPVTPLGIDTSLSFVHPPKVCPLRDVSCLGRTILSSEEQPWNAPYPIVCIFSEREISVRFGQ